MKNFFKFWDLSRRKNHVPPESWRRKRNVNGRGVHWFTGRCPRFPDFAGSVRRANTIRRVRLSSRLHLCSCLSAATGNIMSNQ
ncbi:unnamed protein product, partial [Nesidiocoris tenuis]